MILQYLGEATMLLNGMERGSYKARGAQKMEASWLKLHLIITSTF